MVVFSLTLIRHGETAHNKDNVIQGQLDVPLSQTGLQQAELLGVHLQYQQYSHVYVSDLTRAKQTAESIIRQNKSFKATLHHDWRLRERFGNVEGKSFKYLREAAEKSNLAAGQYTPPGGETIQQVHERAVSFFKDLCEMVKECPDLPTINQTTANGSHDNGKLSGQKRKWENGENDSSCNNEVENISKVHVKETLNVDAAGASSTVKSNNGIDNVKNGASNQFEKIAERSRPTLDVDSLQNGGLNEKGPFSAMFTDDDIRSQIMSNCNDIPNIECPNVSLSPLVDQNFISLPVFSLQEKNQDLEQERRLSVCSSCDDADSGPTLMANILVVSHGGWLRELFRHFVEDLDCSVPGGRKQALRISPNAGLSKFTVSLEDHDGHPKIICLQIHDKQHLVSTCYNNKILSPDEVAL
ncbi:fructose-2,6-bisphosphatase TIGAR isoform X2 [Parasteatoda tepidariorum]|uniref:fructose-2,6-bisphosphatase TIGAR isoform X2 n=1 Tax=Parasteatoda tepidariorum TaxID=114398 RepID=UPI0039BC296A